MMRRLIVLLVLLLPVGSAFGPPAAGEEDPFAEPIRVLVHADDAGLNGIWDGIKTGLEFANLDRAGRDDLSKDPEAVLKRLEAEKPPLLFVAGARAARVLGDRLLDVPRVYVTTAWSVNGEEFPPRVLPRPPARVLYQVTYAVKVAEVLRALWPPRPKGLLSWTPKNEVQRRHADALALAAGFERVERAEDADLLLHLRLGVGEEAASIEDLVALAKAHQLPLLSDDVAHWREKASILVVPNYKLLGRIAAEQGRLLLEEEKTREAGAPRPPDKEAGLTEIWVDLAAARVQGLPPPPIAWLARVDHLRDRRASR